MSARERSRDGLETTTPALTYSYSIAGAGCAFSAEPDLLDLIDATYSAFRVETVAGGERGYELALERGPSTLRIRDSLGQEFVVADEAEGVVRALDLIVQYVVRRLGEDGLYAIHAAALELAGRGLIISGRSGAGKTTLALALLTRGFRLLSDEFALSAPDARSILPYRRSAHVRPATLELIPQLAFLEGLPRQQLGGGSEWSLTPESLDRVFPGCLGGPSTVSNILLLEAGDHEGRSALEPLAAAQAAIELVRATPAAAEAFTPVLARLSRLADGARCALLRPGTLESALDLVTDWVAQGATASPPGDSSRA